MPGGFCRSTMSSLEEALKNHLDRHGGVVMERLVTNMRSEYSNEAPELANEQALKAYIESKPDTFRISTSVNGIERARLTNPRRASRGLIGLTIKALEELVRPAFCTHAAVVRSMTACGHAVLPATHA
jgi:hypothetical protein